MKFTLILSFLCLTVCIVAFSQEKRSGKSAKHNIAVTEKGLIKISVMYPYAEGKTFNMEYYETKHMPMVAGYLGSNLVKYTIEKGLSSGGSDPNQPLPFMAIGTFYVKSLSEYKAAVTPNSNAIRADFVNYTNVIPIILVSEVIR
ncbi:EthD family reductase [Chitinophaga sp. 212800010-3]|uniref:EthD family reductase n=1 Tax=unclassified Chitinophaga TaxID=2619133 RepID=UPI002DEC4128|nr:EthD domain-containing protein [Chitinophaga sp. 212800010-3]